MLSYSNMAQLYDELMEDVDYDKWYEYICDIIKEKNINPKNVLEMACGTGNLTEKLCESDFNVTCFDLSDEMLVVAYEKLKKYHNVNVLKQNMVNFNVKDRFELVLSICDSINYITDKEDLLNAFKRVHYHLKEDGLFIFDINSKYKLENVIAKNVFVNDYDNVFYTWESEHDEENSLVNFFLTFFLKEGDKYNRFDEMHTERVYEKQELIGILKEAGFSKIEVFEAFTFDEPRCDSMRLNFVVSK